MDVWQIWAVIGVTATAFFGIIAATHRSMTTQGRAFTAHIDGLRREMVARFETVGVRFDEMERRTSLRFDAVDQRFNAVDQRFNAVDQRFATVEACLTNVESGLEKVRTTVSDLSHNVQALNARVLDGARPDGT